MLPRPALGKLERGVTVVCDLGLWPDGCYEPGAVEVWDDNTCLS